MTDIRDRAYGIKETGKTSITQRETVPQPPPPPGAFENADTSQADVGRAEPVAEGDEA